MKKIAFLTEILKTAQEFEEAGLVKAAIFLDKIAEEVEKTWDFQTSDLDDVEPVESMEFTLEDLEEPTLEPEVEIDFENAKVEPSMTRAELNSLIRNALVRIEQANKKRFGPNAFFFAYPGLDQGPIKDSEIKDALGNIGIYVAEDGSNWDKVVEDLSAFEDRFNQAVSANGLLKQMDVLKYMKNKQTFVDRFAVQSPFGMSQKPAI